MVGARFAEDCRIKLVKLYPKTGRDDDIIPKKSNCGIIATVISPWTTHNNLTNSLASTKYVLREWTNKCQVNNNKVLILQEGSK